MGIVTFCKTDFPLLIVGVFVVGMIRDLIQPAWIEALAGLLYGTWTNGTGLWIACLYLAGILALLAGSLAFFHARFE